MAVIIDGKAVSDAVKEQIREQTEKLGIKPGLAVVLVGEDAASRVYVRNKKRACEQCGFYSESYELPEQTTQQELLELISVLNANKRIHGILVQFPLPRHISQDAVTQAISPLKDVDAFNPENVGRIMLGNYRFLPCTPAGVTELLHHYGINVAGRECVVVGRSNIVGKPMSMLLLHEDATVTVCHSKTSGLAAVTKRADIVISAVGKAGFITADMIKDGAVVIDVGINRGEDGKLCGDVDFDACKEKASYITPVPGGVGPMTIATLMQNTITAAKIQNK